jgi:hypothetical protein
LRKESILAKHVSNWENKDPEQEKLEKIKAMYEEYSKPPPPDHMRTFTNLVVKKEDPSKKRVVNTHHGSQAAAGPGGRQTGDVDPRRGGLQECDSPQTAAPALDAGRQRLGLHDRCRRQRGRQRKQ